MHTQIKYVLCRPGLWFGQVTYCKKHKSRCLHAAVWMWPHHSINMTPESGSLAKQPGKLCLWRDVITVHVDCFKKIRYGFQSFIFHCQNK